MSYRFGMCFKNVKNKIEMYDFALEFTKKIYENAEEFINLNKYYIPTHNKYIFGEKAYEFNDVDRFWLYNLFNVRFIYWEEYNLLGIIGDNYPKVCLNMIDEKVYFQNSCDQDYEYEEWGNSITFFNNIIEKAKQETPTNLIKEFNEVYKNYTLKEIEEDIDYFRKSFVYQTIFHQLDLGNWLYDKEGNFKTFAFSAIENQKQLLTLSRLTRIILNKMEQEDETMN